MRAFACLLEELLAFAVPDADVPRGQARLERLQALQADCAQEDVAARPLFADVVAALSTLLRD